MKLGEFRDMTELLGDETEMLIFNDGFEWYGVERFAKGAWKVIEGELIFNFENEQTVWREELMIEAFLEKRNIQKKKGFEDESLEFAKRAL
jgi:hypothetical protein